MDLNGLIAVKRSQVAVQLSSGAVYNSMHLSEITVGILKMDTNPK